MLKHIKRARTAAPIPSTVAAGTHDGVPMFGNGLHLPITSDMWPTVLERARAASLPDPDEVFLVDWAGVRTRIPMLAWAPQEFAGTSNLELPIPSDGYRSEAEEYVGLILSLTSERDDYVVVEVGAGWAPWAVMGTLLAKRAGRPTRGIAVEADGDRARWAVQHASDNGLSVAFIAGDEVEASLPKVDADVVVVQAAAWPERTTLRFPVLDSLDMGGAVNPTDHPSMDNRGAHFDYVAVPTVTLDALLADVPVVDLLHIDLQGYELDVILPALALIESKVRFLMVGTHNRHVEGMLVHTLLAREWALLAESPCTSVYDGVKPSLTGFTVQDGNQLYANSRFRDADPLVIRQT